MMMTTIYSSYKSLGASVIGSSHIKKGLENQDSVSFKENIIAISDGHGSAGYTRSSLGSKFATEIILEIYEDSLNENSLEEGVRHLKARFLHLWQKAVELDLLENEITEEEMKLISNKKQFFDNFNKNKKVIYGTTFLCAIIYKENLILLSCGDGDVLCIYEEEVIDLTLHNEKNFANATLSLASLKDSSEISSLITDAPSLISLSTDGIKNSYNDTDELAISNFYKIPIVIRKSILEEGEMKAKDQIIKFLEKITKEGSGDDVTIAVLYKGKE